MNGAEHRGFSRRRFAGAICAGAATALAGCLGEADPTDADGSEDGSSDGAERYSIEGHPIDEPVEFDDEHRCAVCNMRAAEYQAWRGQLAHEDATGRFFDTPGCLFAYLVAPEHFDGPDSSIANAWTTDYETGELIDADAAHFVLERDDDRAEDGEPMGLNPRPFADRTDAEAYVDRYDDLSTDDVVGLDEVDREAAAIYRGNRLP